MNLRTVSTACLALLLVVTVLAAENVRESGPKVGEELPGTFVPLNVTGPDAGKTTCIFCEYDDRPVAMVFARGTSEPLTHLIKRLDSATAKHKPSGLGSFVVFLSSEEGLGKQLKQLAEQEKLGHTVLRTFKPEGPKGYNVSKEAEVTVILYTDRVVKAKHVFGKGELKEKDVDAILADLPRILPAKK